MKQHKDYNNKVTILRKLTDPLKLRQGEKRVFVVNGIHRDPKYTDRLNIPSSVIVPSKDTIMVDNETIDIASIRSIGAGDVPQLHTIRFTKERAGTITLTGGIPNDQLMYEYMMLCNYNGSNPNRDTTKRNIFTLIDPVGTAKSDRKSRMTAAKAINLALEMTDEEVATFAGASGWTITDLDITRNQMEKLAEENPEHFLKFAMNRKNNIKADISNAMNKDIIAFDKAKSQFTWVANGELIVSIPRSTAGNHLDGMLEFIVNTEVGQAVYDEIKAILKDGKASPVEQKQEDLSDLETTPPNPTKLSGGKESTKKK